MKTRMIIKYDGFMYHQDAEFLKERFLEEWNNKGIILLPKNIEIQAIISEDDKGEIKVIRLEDGRVKTRIKILEKIKKLFKRKNKAESIDK